MKEEIQIPLRQLAEYVANMKGLMTASIPFNYMWWTYG